MKRPKNQDRKEKIPLAFCYAKNSIFDQHNCDISKLAKPLPNSSAPFDKAQDAIFQRMEHSVILTQPSYIYPMAIQKIKTYNVESFLEKNTFKESEVRDMLEPNYEKFFIVKVEEMLKTMKLPIPPSKSTIHTLIFLTEGDATMTIGSERFTIQKNECLIVPAGQVFSFSNYDVNKGYLVSFHTDFIVGKYTHSDWIHEFDFLKVWGNHTARFDSDAAKSVHAILKRMWQDYRQYQLTKTDLILPYFMAFLSELNRAYQPYPKAEKSSAQLITNRFKELVYEHMKTKHLVSQYAGLLNITPNHLNKNVKTITGKTAIQWIDEAIVLEAKVLLHQTPFSISEIAEEVGFLDHSYFIRMFKKYEGITPLQFRKMIEKS